MANNFRSDALNLIGSYSDGYDSDSSDNNEPVTATVELNTLNISSVSVEESNKQPSSKTFDSHVGISDMILQDDVPHVGMDYTIDSDPLDESNCAQIQLIESQVNCGGSDADASDQRTGEQKWAEKSSVKSDNNASERHHPNGSDHAVQTTVEILSDHTVQLEGNETLDDEIQTTPVLKEEQTHIEDEQRLIRPSAINETNSSEYVSAPEAQTKAEADDYNPPVPDSTLYVGDDSYQQLSREGSSQHHGYYDEHGYDQQYSNEEQQCEYQRPYNQHQYYEEHVPNHGKEQYDSTAEHQQDYVQVEGTSTSIQDGQQWHIQSDHQHPDHHKHPQLEQQLYLMSNQNQHINQCEYVMSEHHHLQPDQQQYPQPEQQQQQYLHPEQQQYPQPEQQQQQYPQPEQQQRYPQPEQQQDYPQPEHNQDCPQPEHQQDYPQPELQQYLHPEQQQQYALPEQQQQYHGSHPEQQQYTQPKQQQQYTQSEQQQQHYQQQQYSQPEQQQLQYPQPEQQQQQYQYPQPGQQQQQYSQSQYEQQQYPQTDQQYYMQQYYSAQPYQQQPDQQQQSYPQLQQPDSQLGCTEHSIVQSDQERYATSEQQHGEPQGEYSHIYQEAYAQQQYSDPHHNHTHGQHRQSYEHQYYDDSNQYEHGSYLFSQGRTHEQSTQYSSYPSREDHETSFDYRKTANQLGGPNYQPYPSYSDPHPQPFRHNHREQHRRGSDHERIDRQHGDREDHRPYHHKWGDNYFSTGEQQSNRLPSHPIYGSSASDTWRDPTHSPVKSDAGRLSDPRLNLDVRNSPQRDYKISGELSDPRRKQRGTKERGRGYEEKHYTRSAKYAKISSTVVSRRPAMLKASNIVKTSEVKSSGPQIIEPHFVSTSPPKTKVFDKGDKSKAPGKFPEATTAKKALANFKIPKHKSSKISSEVTTLKSPMKIPALDLPETSNEECSAENLPHNTAKVEDNSAERDTTDYQGKSAAQGKETKVSTKVTKVLPSNAPAKILSNLDATTLQALTTIVHQTLKMAANKGMPVAKSITSGMPQLSEMTLSSHSGEMQNVTTITPTTATMAAAPNSTTTAVSSTSTASCLSSAASNSLRSTIPSCATATPAKGQMISLESQVLGLQSIPAPTVSVALATTVQEQFASSPVSSAEASSPTPVEVVSLSAPKAEQAPGTEKSDSAVSDTMTVLPKAKITSTSAPGTRCLARKTSGIVLATILSDASSQIKGKSTTVPTVVVSNPRVLVPHTMSSCPPLPSINATVQMTPATDSTLVANSVMVKKSTLFTSKEGDHFSEQSVKKIDIDAQAESKKANITHKSPPRLEYFNADLMFKEYNLRQSTASRDGSPLKQLQESVENHGNSCESSKPGKRARSPQSGISSVHKKMKIDEIRSQGNDTCRHDHQPLSSGNPTKNAMHSTKGRSLRRKACVQRRKSWSHQRPQLHGMSQECTCDDLLCAFCHQRGGAMNLGFLYGPYKFDPVSITSDDHIDANKDSIRDHQRELWVHEDCAVWAPGVCLVGDQLIGLQEAIVDGDHMMCEVCKTSGATLCCTAHGCKSAYHFPCAQETGCTLKGEQFLICCSKHKGTM